MTFTQESNLDPTAHAAQEGGEPVIVKTEIRTPERRPWEEGDYIMALPTELSDQFPVHVKLIPDGKPMSFSFRVLPCIEDYDENTPDIEIQVALENDSCTSDGSIVGWVKRWFEYGEGNVPQEVYADDSPDCPKVGVEFTPFATNVDPESFDVPTTHYICSFFVHEE